MSIINYQLPFGTRTISYKLERKSRKTLGIKVYPDSAVEVLAPMESSDTEVVEKLRSKAAWVIKQQDFFAAFRPHTSQRQYVGGETHRYLGRQYRLRIEEGERESIKLMQGQLVVLTPLPYPSHIEKQLEKWYEAKAQIVFQELFKKALILFTRYDFPTPTLHIRRMEKRWGSCSRNGKITLNTELIKASKANIEYVMVHELCHLVHFNHKKEFYALLRQLLPDWEKRKAMLEKTMV